jgi:hypothetical protein
MPGPGQGARCYEQGEAEAECLRNVSENPFPHPGDPDVFPD